MEYRPPQLKRMPEESKFIRIGDDIHMTDPFNMTTHKMLAHGDRIHAEVMRLRQEDPVQVDAGDMISTYKDGTWEIVLSRGSDSLKVPIHDVSEEARKITADRIREMSPGCEVVTDTYFSTYSMLQKPY